VKRKHNLLTGDSHARGCIEELPTNLGNPYEVTGYVKSGTGLQVIANTVREEIDNLTRDDVVAVEK
jgi:hypothetical protein